MKFIKDIEVKDKLVLVRNDFNVPLNQNGKILDDTRIRASLPTIEYLIEAGARIVLCSHLGRPQGEFKSEFSLKPVAHRLSELLDRAVEFQGETIGKKVEIAKQSLKSGQILLLENLRFHPGETGDDPEFARELATGIDVYVNNAFGASHREHASVTGIARLVPDAVAGLLMKKEIDYLSLALEKPSENYVLILGGAKVSDKIPVIDNLIGRATTILIGGAMAYTFLKAQGVHVGNSRVEDEYIPMCQELLDKARANNVKLMLPVDHVAAVKLEANVTIRMVERGKEIPEDMMGLDIGYETTERYMAEIRRAALIVWNGPMGVFEIDEFSSGTISVARAIADCSATSIVGGGDSVAALNKAGVAAGISHISTGGGASLEFLSGKILPGIKAIS
jgi:phosphoglycerate kinase